MEAQAGARPPCIVFWVAPPLGDGERRHDGGLPLVGGILGDLAVDPAAGVGGEHGRRYRSIDPKTMSCVPMIATTSAIMCPRDISSSAERWT